MSKLTIVLILCLALFEVQFVSAKELYVVVNKQNPITTLTKQQITDLFMGRSPYFPSGAAVMKLDAPGSSLTRQLFYQALVSMSLPEVNAYWARLMFSGRATPPMQVASEQDMLQLVSQNPSAIGYLLEGASSDEIKVIFTISLAD